MFFNEITEIPYIPVGVGLETREHDHGAKIQLYRYPTAGKETRSEDSMRPSHVTDQMIEQGG